MTKKQMVDIAENRLAAHFQKIYFFKSKKHDGADEAKAFAKKCHNKIVNAMDKARCAGQYLQWLLEICDLQEIHVLRLHENPSPIERELLMLFEYPFHSARSNSF